jgi:asparagine synthetase B (glutamine-hydrolysing)
MTATPTDLPMWSESDVYEGDPLRPDLDIPTPAVIVADLSLTDRVTRVEFLMEQAFDIHAAGIAEHLRGRAISSVCVLFSGGNDSTTLTHLFKDQATHAIHANTTIGIEQTRQFVRDTCRSWRLEAVTRTRIWCSAT